MSDEVHSYIQLQQQIHDALRVQHLNWSSRTALNPPVTRMSHALPNSAFSPDEQRVRRQLSVLIRV
jgi:hypothetical protein